MTSPPLSRVPFEKQTAELQAEDLVLGVCFGGMARAYPLWILGSREIVND